MHTIAIEDMKIGTRYVKVNPGLEHAFTVKSTKQYQSNCQMMRDGEWTTWTIVEVEYNNGITLKDEIGTRFAVHGEWVA